MKLNNVSKVGAKIARIRFAIGLIVLGAIFAVIGGLILSTILSSGNSDIILPVVILVIGVVAAIVGIILLVIGIKSNKDQLQQVDMTQYSQEEISAVASSNEAMNDYYFHFNGKMNQSYVLETLDRKPLVTLHCDKFGIATKYKYTFKNELTGKETKYEVSHTLTLRTGSEHISLPLKSTFKVNGEDVFKLIGNMGYSIVSKIEGVRLNFDVCHLGTVVGSLTAGGADVLKDGKKYGAFGSMPTRGVFTVKARESDLDAVALIAFAVSRVGFF